MSERKNCECRICNSKGAYPITIAKEWRQGRPETFEYFKCEQCGCLQLLQIPSDMGEYYKGYYALKDIKEEEPILLSKVRQFCLKSLLREGSYMGSFLRKFFPHFFYWVIPNLFEEKSRILDLGCGSGRILLKLNNSGFKNILGVDPYIEKTLTYKNGVTVLNTDLCELNDSFDLIMLHHVLEHIPNQSETFNALKTLLSPQGTLLINVPVIDSYPWRTFGPMCFQLEDAPRHIFLHTEESIRLMAEQSGFIVEKVKYYSEPKVLRRNDKREQFEATRAIRREASNLAEKKDSGLACFYLKHK